MCGILKGMVHYVITVVFLVYEWIVIGLLVIDTFGMRAPVASRLLACRVLTAWGSYSAGYVMHAQNNHSYQR